MRFERNIDGDSSRFSVVFRGTFRVVNSDQPLPLHFILLVSDNFNLGAWSSVVVKALRY
jgi:hypothetical protein